MFNQMITQMRNLAIMSTSRFPGDEVEEKILQKAMHIFSKKGFSATKTRDIATAAGVNIASIHYYFRSKEKLFQIVVKRKLKEYTELMERVLGAREPLHQKIRDFVPLYIDFFLANPYLPRFIFLETSYKDVRLESHFSALHFTATLEEQLEKLEKEKRIRPTSVESLLSTLIGLTVFPFISQKIMRAHTGQSETEYQAMLEQKKIEIPQMIIHQIFLRPDELVFLDHSNS